MGAHPHDSPAGPAGGRLGEDLAARVAAIVHAAEREARAAEQAIADQRRSAEEEARRYLAAARLRIDADAAARAARVETLTAAARRLSAELTDAVAALTRELQSDERAAALEPPRPPWPPAHAAPAPEPTWSRIEEPDASAPTPSGAGVDRAGGSGPARPDDAATPLAQSPRAAASSAEHDAPPAPAPAANGAGAGEVPSAARLVAIEMAVGGSSRAEVEQHLRDQLGVPEPEPLLDDVFGVASHAGSRLAWGEP